MKFIEFGVQKDMLRRRPARRQRGLQPLVEVTDAREEQVAADRAKSADPGR